MNKVKSFIVGIAVLILLSVGGIYVYQKSIKPTILEQKTEATPAPASKFKIEATPAPAVQTNQKTNINIAPSTGEDPHDIGIIISQPTQNSKITSPLQLVGSANVLDSVVNLVILDANRKVLGTTYVTACMAASACPFQADITFTSPSAPTGTIEAFANPTQANPQPNLQIVNIHF